MLVSRFNDNGDEDGYLFCLVGMVFVPLYDSLISTNTPLYVETEILDVTYLMLVPTVVISTRSSSDTNSSTEKVLGWE